MSIGDDLLEEYYVLASGMGETEAKNAAKVDPYKAKHQLASLITARYHGEIAAASAADAFMARFKAKEWPTAEELREQGSALQWGEPSCYLPKLIAAAGAALSNSEALRLIKANAVEVDQVRVDPNGDLNIDLSRPRVIKVGKRRFFVVESK
jgi:tyrosyl-tRNA synthetase